MQATDIRQVTQRLVLRRYRESDFHSMADMHGRPEVVRFLPWAPRDDDEARAVFEHHREAAFEHVGDTLCLAGVRRQTGAFVGEFVLKWCREVPMTAEIGYILHPDSAGQGLATEGAEGLLSLAFDRFGFHRVVAHLHASNVASIRILEKLGMRREGHFRESFAFKGRLVDELVYALLAAQWRSNRRSHVHKVETEDTVVGEESDAGGGA